ncbi:MULTISPECIES: NAD(P)H-dependent oxidoreductase subunit E [Marichromatium]|uniref:NADH-quinone oxidoreductase subunit E n=1 Tax=Marichromatium gracile TaxID=1048 RepID=A0A4R4A6F7_MARGR|nr:MULTISPECIES: NAD(P)H-dependent oxidoreductase subunit E [Marichromatium]MBO8084873.1 NAD(P)H-dependent oxidoreductase subunit E [Marichromatium sp.]MBK1709699.1 NAD(P)H-dependent oxidoreductase subunit E [Marichromatium gracile]RNE91001.1 NAD(P)H-dependent oxidoreductase subunit E [Marichromatium sp. AB31]RNE93776.1 NAD(P)H-dependent oxidoreductase subunit E [Marichromatium sp. AB32]TCW34367.1 NADH dehydrogenase subunit E [Marichromatium gracile]
MSFRTTPLTVAHDRDKSTLFTAELREAIDALLTRYPEDWQQSAVMPALTLLQDANGGWLTRELMDDLAAYLDMPEVAVYEVATFYGMYDLEPQGRHKVCVCNSVSCMLRGSETLIEHVGEKYGVGPGETTADGRFTLKEVECLGACRHAPAVLVDKTYHENLSPEALDELIDGLE